MNDFQLQLTRDAFEDLAMIKLYYESFFSSAVAAKVLRGIEHRIRQLSSFPKSGALLSEQWLADQNYRMVISGEYAAIYRIEDNFVIVYRVVNGRQEYSKLIRQIEE